MTTLLIDLNNLVMRNFFTGEIGPDKEYPEYNLWKYQIFTQIYWDVVKHRPDQVILAADGKDSWRKVYFPRYKEDRSKKRRDDIDWTTLFKEYHKFQNHIKNCIPFKVMHIDRVEGDDIIGVLCQHLPDTCIVSSNDSDFTQLCSERVRVWNPSKKEFMNCPCGKEEFITKLCLKGQAKDNIFNVKTPSDYPEGLRKPGVGDKTVDKILMEGLDTFLDTPQKIKKKYTTESGDEDEYVKEFTPRENYDRNRILIDFEKIPSVVKNAVIKKFKDYQLPNPEKMYGFFRSNGWTGYLEDYDRVEQTLLNLY